MVYTFVSVENQANDTLSIRYDKIAPSIPSSPLSLPQRARQLLPVITIVDNGAVSLHGGDASTGFR